MPPACPQLVRGRSLITLFIIVTSGSNIVNIQKVKEGEQNTNSPPDVVSIREIGGSMAPIWKNMVESGKTQVNRYFHWYEL